MSQAQNFPHYFTGYIQDNKIFTQSYEGTQQLGVTLQAYAELKSRHDDLRTNFNDYQQRLMNLVCPRCGNEYSEIEVPLTPEEQAKKQEIKIDQLQTLVMQLTNQVQTLIGVSHEHNVINSERRRQQSETHEHVDGSGATGPQDVKAPELEARTDQLRKPAQRKNK